MMKSILFTSIGDNTYSYKTWYNQNRNYTIIFVYYGKNQHRYNTLSKYCDRIYWKQGTKFQNFVKFSDELPQYDFIWITDDDLSLSCENINKMFQLCRNYHLKVCSPSHNPSGALSWKIMKTIPRGFIRKTNFVEVTCPCLRSDEATVLVDFLRPHIDSLYEWGIDYIMQNILLPKVKNFYILDCISVRNPKPYEKPKKIREINTTSSNAQRCAMWKRKMTELQFKEFPKFTYGQIHHKK